MRILSFVFFFVWVIHICITRVFIHASEVNRPGEDAVELLFHTAPESLWKLDHWWASALLVVERVF